MTSSNLALRSASSRSATDDLVLIILNNTLPAMTRTFWRRTQMRLCADGGANRLHQLSATWPKAGLPKNVYMPDLITGDMDSIMPEILQHYAEQGSEIVDLSDDQDSTDLDKCLKLAEKILEPKVHPQYLAIGAMGGRFDHTLSNLNALYKYPHMQLTLCGEGNMVSLLAPGAHHIRVDRSREGPHCGLSTLSPRATVSARGLKYDMDHLLLGLGAMQSTSNQVVSDEVFVETDQPLLWSLTFRDKEEPP